MREKHMVHQLTLTSLSSYTASFRRRNPRSRGRFHREAEILTPLFVVLADSLTYGTASPFRLLHSGHAEQKALIAKQRQQRGRQGSHQSSSDVLAKLKLSEAAKKQVRAKAETVRKAEEERYVRPQQIQDRNRGRQPLSAFGITDESRGQIPGSPSNPPRRDH